MHFVCTAVGEHRHHECVQQFHNGFDYRQLSEFKTSVIVTFYNEGWNTLLRTVFSILHTTPKCLLEEIILIDDDSSFGYLKKPLDDVVNELNKQLPNGALIKIVRLGQEILLNPHLSCVNYEF